MERPQEIVSPLLSGERIKNRRKALGITQQELAERVGFAQCTVSNYERGRDIPSVRALSRLAVELNTSADYLAGLTEDPNPSPFGTAMADQEIELLKIFYSLPPYKRERAVGMLIGLRDS